MNWSKYNYVNTKEKLEALDRFLITDNQVNYPVIALDTETNGLFLHKASVIGFSLAINNNQGFYLPLVEWVPDLTSKKTKSINKEKYEVYVDGHFKCVWTGKIYPEFFTPYEYDMPEFIPQYLERWFGSTNIILHNAPFDVNHIYTISKVDLTNAVLLDTALLSHVLNENSPNGLKETANEWKTELGINPHVMADQERRELGSSVIRNGGLVTKSGHPKTIWRAEPSFMCKYACADAFLTFGLYEVGVSKLERDFGEKGLTWFFEEEIMPVCKEVVIPMKRNGVRVDIEHFSKMEQEVKKKYLEIEDEIIEILTPDLGNFYKEHSIEKVVTEGKLVKKLIELENLKIPTKLDKKTGIYKETLAKKPVEEAYQKDPHWLWAYILGEGELQYSEESLRDIKQKIYEEETGKRHLFNIGSLDHLKWLFCEHYGIPAKSLPQTDSATKDNPIPQMDEEVLTEYMLPKYPWVAKLLTFKKLKKMHSTYISPALELNIDGWLYMDMKQNGTVSGRFACSGGFNLQTLPNIETEMETLKECDKCDSKNVELHYHIEALADRSCKDCGHVVKDIICSSVIKKGFIAPKGYKIVNADYSSLEPRCFSYMSGDEKLKAVYKKELDLYSKVYCDMFDKEGKYSANPKDANFLKKLNSGARKMVKPVVLAIPYGANKYQVATLLNKTKEVERDGKKVTVPDTEYGDWFIKTYLNTYKHLALYMEKMELECLQKGFVEAICGRRRHFQYAPKIYRTLRLKGLNHQDLIDASPSKLKTANCTYVSPNGILVKFTEEDLKGLMKEMGLSYEKCQTNEYWSYIRNLLKADVNNAKNFPIQALAGHITNRGMLETTRLYRQHNLDAIIFLQVHDEISTYVKDDEFLEQGAECLRIGMEENFYAKKIDVPMIAAPTVCTNLKDSK